MIIILITGIEIFLEELRVIKIYNKKRKNKRKWKKEMEKGNGEKEMVKGKSGNPVMAFYDNYSNNWD